MKKLHIYTDDRGNYILATLFWGIWMHQVVQTIQNYGKPELTTNFNYALLFKSYEEANTARDRCYRYWGVGSGYRRIPDSDKQSDNN